jgi:DNA-binding MarR family transcriptional regulator
MNGSRHLPLPVVYEVRDTCQCFAAQRHARQLARRFDAIFHPLGLTNGQFSLMVALAAPRPWRVNALAEFLAMDRTTLTAMLNPLRRRKLVSVAPDKTDKRARLVTLNKSGHALIMDAVPLWRAEHAKLAQEMAAPHKPKRAEGRSDNL